jgi:hypothetical protein
VPLAPGAGLKVFARGTPGFLGAELRAMVMTGEEKRSGG